MRASLCLGFSLVVCLLIGAGPALAEVTPVVIAVGVNNSFDPGLAPLHFAETDAERFAQTMATVGDVPQRSITLLRSPAVDEFVKTVLYQARIAKDEAKDPTGKSLRLILYFSGHADDRGLHFRTGALSRRRLQMLLQDVGAATKVLFIDSCFSGAIAAKGVTPDAPFDLPKLDMDELTGSVFLTASAAGEAAYESEELSGGLFTHDVVAGLNGAADANSDGLVTVDELYQYVYRETRLRSLTYTGSNSQHPEFHADLHGHGALVLAKPRRVLSTLKVDPGIIGTVQLISMSGLGSYSVYGQPQGEKEFNVPEGSYRAVIRRGDVIGEASVMIARNETVELSPSQFTWGTTDMPAPRATKGTGALTAVSTMYAVSMREELSGTMESVGLERDQELIAIASASSKLALVGSLGVEATNGIISSDQEQSMGPDGYYRVIGHYADHYQEDGAGGIISVILSSPNAAARLQVGVGAYYQFQHWITENQSVNPSQLQHGALAPVEQVGLILPLAHLDSGNWSVIGRREVHYYEDVTWKQQTINQYSLGIVLEP